MKIQHAMLTCRNLLELQQIQVNFVRNAVRQYKAETGKLLQIGTEVFASLADGQKAQSSSGA